MPYIDVDFWKIPVLKVGDSAEVCASMVLVIFHGVLTVFGVVKIGQNVADLAEW